jgi:hypothetical protein
MAEYLYRHLSVVLTFAVVTYLVIHDLSGYERVAPFSNSYIPMFWLQLVSVTSPVVLSATCRIF